MARHSDGSGIRSDVLEPPPTDLNEPAVAVAVADGWGFLVQTVEYMPVGAGGYHWNVTDSTGRSLFVTADDLDTKDWLGDDRNAIAQGLIAALDTARRLRHEAHLGFVVAPLAAGDGRPAVRLGDRYSISVYPWLVGRSHPFGPQTDPNRRDSTLDMLIALHTVDPPAGTPHHICPRVGARRDLEAFLVEPADPWNEGPCGEQARAVFAPHVDQLKACIDSFDRAAQPAPARVVVTHGEPHGGNLMTVGDDVVLIDGTPSASLHPSETCGSSASTTWPPAATPRPPATSRTPPPWRSTGSDGSSTTLATWSSSSAAATTATRTPKNGSVPCPSYSTLYRQHARRAPDPMWVALHALDGHGDWHLARAPSGGLVAGGR